MSATQDLATTLEGRTLADRVRNAVLLEMSSGRLLPGEPLDEKRMCERFGVSRTPVREALLQLVVQGFAVAKARGQVVIPKLTLSQLRNALELIGELEATAARLAAKRATAQERRAIEQAQNRCVDLADHGPTEAYESANVAFHASIHQAAHNDLLTAQIHQLRTRVAGYTRDRFDSPGRMRRSCDEHDQVVTAILAGDERGAWQAMADHAAIGGKDFADFASGVPSDLLEG